MRNTVRFSLLFVLLLPALTRSQEQVVTGPPPQIRALIDAFVTAVNAGGSEFEAMAKAHFAPGYLSKRTAAERARLFDDMRKQFGTVTRERVVRNGPDEPLELNVRGSNGTTGVIYLATDPESPFKISDVTIETAARKEGGRGGRSAAAAVVPIDPSMSDDALGRALDSYLSGLVAQDHLSGAVVVAKNSRPIFQKAYGYADRANQIANTTATRFNVGSINKTFTQIAIAQLIAAGKLAATDTLGALLPDYPQATSKRATVAQLLNHTAGLADFFGEEFSRTAKDRFRRNADYFALVSRLPPLFEPGARNQYCNGCYIALGAIIERVSGVPYERYVAEHVFAPAGMKHTGYPQTDGIEPGVALGYTRRAGDGLRSNIHLHGAAGSAAGGGYSTVGDLLAFDTAVRTGRLATGGRAGGAMGIAGGAPGINAVLESVGMWTAIVLSNLDPPSAESLGMGIVNALARTKQ
jgi:CubicO group peptidase (beta-lactamase class C family)